MTVEEAASAQSAADLRWVCRGNGGRAAETSASGSAGRASNSRIIQVRIQIQIQVRITRSRGLVMPLTRGWVCSVNKIAWGDEAHTLWVILAGGPTVYAGMGKLMMACSETGPDASAPPPMPPPPLPPCTSSVIRAESTSASGPAAMRGSSSDTRCSPASRTVAMLYCGCRCAAAAAAVLPALR